MKYFANIINEQYDLHNADKQVVITFIKHFRHIDAYYNCIRNVAPEVIVGVKRIV